MLKYHIYMTHGSNMHNNLLQTPSPVPRGTHSTTDVIQSRTVWETSSVGGYSGRAHMDGREYSGNEYTEGRAANKQGVEILGRGDEKK